jgi:hypothetical protein
MARALAKDVIAPQILAAMAQVFWGRSQATPVVRTIAPSFFMLWLPYMPPNNAD